MSAQEHYSVVWFKRDLRIEDHLPLLQALQHGPVLCLYIVEPSLWAAPDAARQHYGFLLESLRDLYRALRKIGGQLQVVTGEVTEVLARLYRQAPFQHLYTHEETGNGLTFQRDLAVARWCRAHGVGWHETPQFGVVRRLQARDHWQRLWDEFMAQARVAAPEGVRSIALPWVEPPPPSADALGLPEPEVPSRQLGGRQAGLQILHEFLVDRSNQYRGGISSPLSAPTACSRLSPYLALGCLSLREVAQTTRLFAAQLPASASQQRAGLQAFISRLYWHCHFIQKLESEPALEFRNLHRDYDGMRENDWNPAHFSALTAGRTGWPLVDACVAMLRETGWINISACAPCWFRWRLTPCGCTGARSASGWPASSSTTNQASTGRKCRCNRERPASTCRASTTRSSRHAITIRAVISCGVGCPICARCPIAGYLSLGACPQNCKGGMACSRASIFRNRWSTLRWQHASPNNACLRCARNLR
jgi:deoxyribodipyrimidine photo-lyase